MKLRSPHKGQNKTEQNNTGKTTQQHQHTTGAYRIGREMEPHHPQPSYSVPSVSHKPHQ
ncbi:hypothetical protein CVS40_7467 [Lucilia cuprina]|nr:hypothetical protein CVS40_7467 [Lucilia cuprina]